jgi:hypothetical protein
MKKQRNRSQGRNSLSSRDLDLLAPDIMTVSLSVLMNGKEVPLGVAYFRWHDDPS